MAGAAAEARRLIRSGYILSGIVWLASYPKSGNTWFRIFVANLLNKTDTPVNINALPRMLACDRRTFDDVIGIESADLTNEEIDALRPEVYEFLATQAKKTLFIKCHDAYMLLPNGIAIFPPKVTKAIYLIRNPLDVAVSYSFHMGESLDQIIEKMGDSNACMGLRHKSIVPSLPQRLMSWSGNVTSWVDAQEMEVHVVRYEDMKKQPLTTFAAAACFASLPCDEVTIRRAIEFSDFRVLKQQEEAEGFTEIATEDRFFREGYVGNWRQHLTSNQVERLIVAHGEVMQRFGYLSTNGQLLI